MSFVKDNEKYERWLRKQCRVVEADLKKKHERMRESAFVFLRATFFRWAKRVEGICTDLAKTPPVLSVGDLHLENFGTWRDAEGRLVWGVNDFDEAAVIPYAFDLVRLATSARLAANLPIGNRAIARARERSSTATATGSNGHDRHCSTSRSGGCDPMWP
jgi:uncharacterized protein (DUF2252 family)